MQVSLLVAQRLYGIEPGRASCGIQAGNQAHDESKNNTEHHQPQGHCPEMFGWQGLTLEVDVRSEVDDLSDSPAKYDPHNPAKDAHRTGLSEKDFPYVAVAGANCFHDADFTASLENGHDQRIDDSDGCNRQREAPENSKERKQDPEDLPQTVTRVENRERVEPHLLDGIFHELNLRRILHAHADRGINRLIARGPRDFAQISGLH